MLGLIISLAARATAAGIAESSSPIFAPSGRSTM
jgi:hypothetical protein